MDEITEELGAIKEQELRDRILEFSGICTELDWHFVAILDEAVFDALQG